MTMNIQYLLDAAAFLESHSSLPLDIPPSATVWSPGAAFFSSNSSSSASTGLRSSISGSSESSVSSTSSRDGGEVSSSSGGSGGGGVGNAEPKILRRFKGKNSRETHNRLEKDRRAYLRECFANLRRAVEIEDPKCSNLAILQSAIRCIQGVKRQEKQFEQNIASLAKRKIELQQQIGDLKRDLSDQNPDPSFDVNLWLKMHVNNVSTNSADASSDEAASVHAWSFVGGDKDRRRNMSDSPVDARALKNDVDAESTSTVSLDENSKEPIFSDDEESGKRRHDAADEPRYADAIAAGRVFDASSLSQGRDISFDVNATTTVVAAAVNDGFSSPSGRFETVIGREDSAPRGESVPQSSVLAAAGQNVAFMTPDGKIILTDERHQLIRSGDSNFIILQPSGLSSYDVVRNESSPRL